MVQLAHAPMLSRFVRDVRVVALDADHPSRAVEYVPDGASHLVFRWFGDALDVSVRGPIRRALSKRVRELKLAVIVAFAPGGAYPFFGAPVSSLADRIVRLDELWGADARALRDDLAEARGDARRSVAALERALVARLRARPFVPHAEVAVRAAVARIARGESSIAAVARDVGVSARTLRRGFHDAVGIGPKTYARYVRLGRALAARQRGLAWAQIARDVGYFDQAHLSAEFRELACRPPSQLGTAPHEACPSRDLGHG
jgi:AraC-like DNA-binding protein